MRYRAILKIKNPILVGAVVSCLVYIDGGSCVLCAAILRQIVQLKTHTHLIVDGLSIDETQIFIAFTLIFD